MEALNRLIGKPCKVVFNDGGEIRAKHGILISTSDGFATIETPHGVCAIKLAEITKIQEGRG